MVTDMKKEVDALADKILEEVQEKHSVFTLYVRDKDAAKQQLISGCTKMALLRVAQAVKTKSDMVPNIDIT